MTGVDDIVPGPCQQLAETMGALIHEPSKRHQSVIRLLGRKGCDQPPAPSARFTLGADVVS